jgi:hypothetical protein
MFDRVTVCFSATASFGVAGVLAGMGAATLIRNEVPSLRMFAAVPVVFAAQQATEGAVWVSMSAHGPSPLAVAAFLSVALVVWPVWLPLSLRAAEREPKRRRVLTVLSVAGLLVGAGCAMLLARWPPTAHVAGHHIGYDFSVGPGDGTVLPIVAYVVPIMAPFFVSSLRLARVMGAVLVVSLVATYVAQRAALTSVWCFFAAILSGLILVIVHREQPARAAR